MRHYKKCKEVSSLHYALFLGVGHILYFSLLNPIRLYRGRVLYKYKEVRNARNTEDNV